VKTLNEKLIRQINSVVFTQVKLVVTVKKGDPAKKKTCSFQLKRKIGGGSLLFWSLLGWMRGVC